MEHLSFPASLLFRTQDLPLFRGQKTVFPGLQGRLPDPHPGPGGLPPGGPFRPPGEGLGLRHRLGPGLRPFRLVLCNRPLEAPLPPPGEAGPGIPA